jgi:phosphoribosylformimino-5-aminoimidazole carboxamide ribotide isomerase
MLIPSIDLMGGKIVQLIGGEKKALEFDDFEPWIQKFEKYPLINLVDLDAVFHQGSNRGLVDQLTKRLKCQVGGGIRTAEDALKVLEAGAHRVVVGSAAFKEGKVNHEFVNQMSEAVGRKRLVFAVDSRHGRVAINGWRTVLELTAEDAMKELEPYCKAYVYTHIDIEGTMSGFPTTIARDLRAATKRQLIVAGGIKTLEQVAELDAMEIDSIVGMAIYSGTIKI